MTKLVVKKKKKKKACELLCSFDFQSLCIGYTSCCDKVLIRKLQATRHSSLNFVVFQWFLSLKILPFNHITAYHCEPGLHGAPESMWSPETVQWFQCSIGFKISQTISSRGLFSSGSGAFDHNTADRHQQMEIDPVFIIRSMFSFLSWAL